MPVVRLLKFLPRKGRILDVGCGHGMIAAALGSGFRGEYFGTEIDPKKLEISRRLPLSSSFHFFSADFPFQKIDGKKFDTILFCDVLYLIPPNSQGKILREAYFSLSPGGRLLVKTIDTTKSWRRTWTWIQERLVTWLGFTRGEAVFFRDLRSWRSLLQEIGFEPPIEKYLGTGYLHPHVLIIARKPKP